MGKESGFDKKSAAKGAAVGSFAGPAGTVVGGLVGGFLSDELAEVDPTAGPRTKDFTSPEFTAGEQFESTYDPNAVSYDPNAVSYDPKRYTGKVDTAAGGDSFLALEDKLGVQGFDQETFRGAQTDALRANVNAAVKGRQAQAGDQAVGQRVANSGMARARKDLIGAEGDRSFVTGLASLEGDIAGLQQNEDARRTAGGMQLTGMDLQNEQFGAGMTDSQDRFGAEFADSKSRFGAEVDESQNRFAEEAAFNEAGFNENVRQFDEQFEYNDALNSYNFNEVAPNQRIDSRRAGAMSAGAQVAGGAFSAIPLFGAGKK